MSPTAAVAILLPVVHYLSPVAVAVCYGCNSLHAAIWLERPSAGGKQTVTRRVAAMWLMLAITLSYAAEAVVYIARALIQSGWWAPQDAAIYVMAQVLVWGCLGLTLLDSPTPLWRPYVCAWLLATLLDIAVCVLADAATIKARTVFDSIGLAIHVLRSVLLTLLSASALFITWRQRRRSHRHRNPGEAYDDCSASFGSSETQPLLGGGRGGRDDDENDDASDASSTKGGSSNGSSTEQEEDRDARIKDLQRQRLEEAGGWWGYLRGFLVFLPYIWPSKNRRMQVYIMIIGVCILSERALNVLIPRQLGIITDRLTEASTTGYMPWREICVFFVLKWLSSYAAVPALQWALEARLGWWSSKELTLASFDHVMRLSMDFHVSKDSGELLRSIQQANSLNSLVTLLVIDTAPVLADLFIAMFYVTYLFDAYFAFTILSVGIIYIAVNIKFTQWTTKLRRTNSERSRNKHRILFECVSNWQTVSYFNRQSRESSRLGEAIDSELDAKRSSSNAALLLRAAQELVLLVGRLTISFLAAWRVSQGTKPVGNFIALNSYWGSLISPLTMLAYSYREVAESLTEAERLLQLLRMESKIPEGDNAFSFQGAQVEFDDVSFAYDVRKQSLSNINFTAKPGQTVALVGETGAGKSTILKLLFRFYDASTGAIRIDGQDIRSLTTASLREAFGIVPQDPSLFNNTIMENVRYARLDASDKDVEEACRAASMHEKILSFPDGYRTKVGERGVKLSGGELQRVAIARVILKNPHIVVLDEATSAVDSATEAQIQDAFRRLSAGRTTFVIAHRLSTIMDADQILVIDNGSIVERGTHQELLDRDGRYVELWKKQSASRTGGGPKTTAESTTTTTTTPTTPEE